MHVSTQATIEASSEKSCTTTGRQQHASRHPGHHRGSCEKSSPPAGDVQGAVTTVQQALAFWQGSGSGSKAARLDAQKWLLQQLVRLRLKVCHGVCKGASTQSCGAARPIMTAWPRAAMLSEASCHRTQISACYPAPCL